MVKQDLRRGYTTGSCAAVAALASCRAFMGELVRAGDAYTIYNLDGEAITLTIHDVSQTLDGIRCSVIKDAGDDPDVTHGLEIGATVTISHLSVSEPHISINRASDSSISCRAKLDRFPDCTFEYIGGQGVGCVTLDGLKIPVGEPAINPVPRQMIEQACMPYLSTGDHVRVIIDVPEGELIAKKTFNQRLGIEGGISIIGTTGRVEPMSERAFIDSIKAAVQVAYAQNPQRVILVYGNGSDRLAKSYLHANQSECVMCSNWVGETLRFCAQCGFEYVILVGPLGKLIKIAAGCFQTHSHIVDARQELIIANAFRIGLSMDQIAELATCRTTDAALRCLSDTEQQLFCVHVATYVCQAISQYEGFSLKSRCLLTDGASRLLVDTDHLDQFKPTESLEVKA